MAGPANTQSPVGQCGVEPATSLAYAQGVNRYTAITTLGTTTVKSAPGLYYGFNALGTGTAAMTVAAFDIGTSTNTLLATTTPAALGFGGNAGATGCGVMFTSALVVVTGGTAGTYNILWD